MKKKLINFFNGNFGKYELKSDYREIWIRFWLCVALIVGVVSLFAAIQIVNWLVEYVTYCLR